jgi:hypothetical protein
MAGAARTLKGRADTVGFAFRCDAAWREWVNGLALARNSSVPLLIETALAGYAVSVGHRPPPAIKGTRPAPPPKPAGPPPRRRAVRRLV